MPAAEILERWTVGRGRKAIVRGDSSFRRAIKRGWMLQGGDGSVPAARTFRREASAQSFFSTGAAAN
jgi:hypothetical protein